MGHIEFFTTWEVCPFGVLEHYAINAGRRLMKLKRYSVTFENEGCSVKRYVTPQHYVPATIHKALEIERRGHADWRIA